MTMDRIRARVVERLLDEHRNLFLFSAKTRRGIGRPVAMLAMVLLPLLSGGGAYPARAEPFVAEQSQSEAAAEPFAKFIAEA
ncbi:MAG: hypothetical protein AB7O57_19275, partial [Hyphomicrobiaceae bacterium]